MKLALAMIVKGSDSEAEVLQRCLGYAAPHVDGVFITITQPNQKVREVAEAFGAVVSEFKWINDFAAARNFNFSQVPKDYDYILWLDADDVLKGAELLKPTIEANPKDAYSMFYLYSFDEHRNPNVVHAKTRVVKNDGCVEWRGKLHEDFKANREIETFHINKIEVLHLSNETRYEAAKERNLEVALEQLKSESADPRSYWNVGNAYKAIGEDTKALEAFETFLGLSQSDDEKYIVHLRMSECYWHLGDKLTAIEQARYGIGTKPNFPDAYFLLGSLYFETRQYEKAAEMYLTGLTKPKPYHKIIVYNPRDYDYTPMMNLAKVYFALSRPDLSLPLLEGCRKIYPNDESLKKTIKEIKKEVKRFDAVVQLIAKLQKIKSDTKLQAEIDKIPKDLRAHPAICNLRNTRLIKTESSGKDLVIYCGYTAEEWTPETAKTKGIGGSEEAVIWLSRLLKEKGWKVEVYNVCGSEIQEFDGVIYKPFWMWNYRDKQDVTILWRTPRYCDYEINSSKIYVDLHDVIPAEEFNEKRLAKIDRIFVKSKFQQDLFPNVPSTKFAVIPNGIDPEVFNQTVERDSKLVINTSAPDRSLTALAQVAKRVKSQVPDAKFQWAYGWGTFDVGYEGNLKVMEWKDDVKRQLTEAGVEQLGRVSHGEIAKMYLKANVWCYPTGFAEIDCISATKAMAGGAITVATDFAALGEKQGHGGFFYPADVTKDTWAQAYKHDYSAKDPQLINQIADQVISILKTPPNEEERSAMREWAKNTYSWQSVADRWNEIL